MPNYKVISISIKFNNGTNLLSAIIDAKMLAQLHDREGQTVVRFKFNKHTIQVCSNSDPISITKALMKAKQGGHWTVTYLYMTQKEVIDRYTLVTNWRAKLTFLHLLLVSSLHRCVSMLMSRKRRKRTFIQT